MDELEKPEKEDLKEESKERTFKDSLLSFLDFLKNLAIIVVLSVLIRFFLIQPYIVEGQSMEPNFHNNDYLITEKVSYKFRDPQRGESVILHPPDNTGVNYIKRVIGLPGDIIKIMDGNVFVNGKALKEPYLSTNEETLTIQGEPTDIVLKEGEYLVLGDNRNHSRDSREIGAIPKSNIVSKVWFRLYPLNNIQAFAKIDYETK